MLVVAVNTLVFAALGWAEFVGRRPPPVATTKPADVIALGLILTALAILEWLYRFERGRLLRRYRKQTKALRAANEALEQAGKTAAKQEALRRELALAREIQTSLLHEERWFACGTGAEAGPARIGKAIPRSPMRSR